METNVCGVDRMIRLTTGPLLAVLGAAVAAGFLDVGLTGTVGLVVAALVLVVGLVLSVTGATQQCPAYAVAGVNPCEQG